jgi:probable phosphoglycerate mutase
MKLYLIRHADPDYANDTITDAGHLEAKALARFLQSAGVDRLYCSPVNRAVHTMRYTAELLGMEPVIEPWTRELDWPKQQADGRMVAPWDVPGESVRASWPFADAGAAWQQRAPYRDFMPLFESLQANSDAFLKRHGYVREGGRYRIEARNREAIAVFCHLGFGLTWLSHLLGLPFPLVWSSFWLAPSSVTTVLFEERSETWAVPRCLGLGSVTHLHQAGLPVSRMGLHANDS